MNDIFKNIGKALDDTALKDIHFNEKHKEKVRQRLQKGHKKQHPFQSIFKQLLPIAVIGFFLIGVSYFVVSELTEQPVAKGDLSQEPTLETNLYIPPIQKEFYGEMTKEDVVSKLLNSIDYFHSAAGKFEEHIIFQDGSTRTLGVTYKVSTKNEIGGYEKLIALDDNTTGIKNDTQEYFYNNKKSWLKYTALNGQKIYTVSESKQKPKRDIVTPEQAFSIDLQYPPISFNKLRERPSFGSSSMSLFAYEKAASYLRHMGHWEIEKQNEALLGHNTIVLAGKMDEEVTNSANLKGTTEAFRFWVDKDTGILVKSETYDQNGELTSYVHPERLEVNVPIDPQEFIPNLDGYQLPSKHKKD
ncbi:hypothetical protein ACVNNN_09960 [Lysinibacillus fusiformis]|uniref:hypothetical protein n=1 Tax=Lysinibacillus sp. PWR01 TaxID=3342384 RepID=UPI00372D6A9F